MYEGEHHSSTTKTSSIHTKFKEGREFLLTPIFKYENDTTSSKSSNNTLNDSLSHDKMYKRKVIDRIVTAIPSSLTSVVVSNSSNGDKSSNYSGNNDERGDVEVCIEEYYNVQSTSPTPILRRVAVRSYVGGQGQSGQQGVMEGDDCVVGIIHASFSLPITQLPRNTIGEQQLRLQQGGNGKCTNNAVTDIAATTATSKNWICWTQFASSYGSNNINDNSKQQQQQKKGIHNHQNTKSQLCVLTGPTTLKIYDVYPNNHSTNSRGDNNNNNNNMSKGEGHTISLPFEASSIFALPSPYYGLLIQRSDNGPDEGVLMTHDDYYLQHQQLQFQQHHLSQTNINNLHNNQSIGRNSDNDGNIAMTSPPPSPFQDDFIIEGPPSTVRLGINDKSKKNKLQPRISEPSLLDSEGRMNIGSGLGNERSDTTQKQKMQRDNSMMGMNASPSPSYTSSDFGVGGPPPLPEVVNNHGMNPMAPSLYTLHHPLDDIVPCIFSSSDHDPPKCKSSDNQKTIWRRENQQQPKTPQTMAKEQPLFHFANVFDQIIYVGKPRSFRSKDEVVIVVTYHTQKKRHSIWIVNDAPLSMNNIPLWQQTSWAFNDASNLIGLPPQNNNVTKSPAAAAAATAGANDGDEMMMMMGETKMNDNVHDYQNNINHPHTQTFLFSELNARIALRCIHIINDPVSLNEESEDMALIDGLPVIESVASQIFLATTPNEDGDYLLCLLQGLSNLDSTENKNLLRCFQLNKESETFVTGMESGNKDSISGNWSVSHFNDIQCVSALPIYSTPVNPPSFSPLESSPLVEELGILWRKKYRLEPPLAKDIFVCKKNNTRNEKMSIFRGDVKIADCLIPTSAQSILNEKSFSISSLQYTVGDRMDIEYRSNENDVVAIRVALSLLTKNSPVTEKSLLAIGSALLPPLSSCNNTKLTASSAMVDLCFAFRADCVISSQLTSLFPEAQELVDDVEWYVFSSLLSSFFAFALNKSSTWESLSCLDTDLENNIDIDTDDDEAWNALLQSEYHMHYYDMHSKSMLLTTAVNDKPSSSSNAKRNLDEKLMQSFVASSCVHWLSNNAESDDTVNLVCSKIFDALHLLYEDTKLGTTSGCKSDACHLGNLLHHLSSRCLSVDSIQNSGSTILMKDFEEMYSIDLWNKTKVMHSAFPNVYFPRRVTMFHKPPSFYSLLEGIIHDGEIQTSVWQHRMEEMVLNGVCTTMGTLLRFFIIYFDRALKGQNACNYVERDRCLVLAMISEGFTHPDQFIERLPLSVGSILIEVCHRCRSDPPPISNKWPDSIYHFLGRADLAKIQDQFFPVGKKNNGNEHKGSTHENTLIAQSFANEEDEDGLFLTERLSAMLFPNDNRTREAAKLLRSSRPTFLRVQRPVEISDHDYERQKQEKLSLVCRRIVALPVGRGMLTYGTLQSLPEEQLSIPPLKLSARIPPRNATLTLEGSQWTSEMKIWPEFHNGVAAGLRLPISKGQDDSEDIKLLEIARTWIVFNKPSPNSTEQPQNNIANNNNPTQSPPQPNHAHGGFLMALGLRGYLSALSLVDICDYLAKGAVTTTTAVGILLGMAANKRGTCDPSVSKMLCLHTPSLLPSSFSSIDVRGPTQAAAIAGIGLLYQKSSHRLMTEFLLNEIGKRPTNEQHIADRESYSLCCGMALGMVNLGLRNKNGQHSKKKINDELSDLRIEDRLLRYIVGGIDETYMKQKNDQSNNMNNSNANDSERCSRIYEGDLINTDVTTPGALLALGLMYIRSGNKSIANQLALPDTNFALDNIRPDFLFMRIVARSLILWDEVQSTPNWIDKQMPVFIKKNYAILKSKLDQEVKSDDVRVEIDPKAMKEAHIYITAGACFSLGLIFAGTGNESIRNSILEKVVQMQKLRDDSDPVSMLLRPQRSVVEMCLGATAIALSLVMAGTGDLKTLRLLKMLRWRCDDGVKYGNHMSYGTAIGILFLGGGACTFGRNPEDIAAMLLAFFPRYPVSAQDNQYHLQALRHIYVLAVKPRRVDAIDIDTNEKTFVPIRMEYDGDQESIETQTPCLLMNRGRLTKISISSDRYYPVEVDFSTLPFNTNKAFQLYVKRKSGCISYVEDPYGLRSKFFSSVARHRASMIDLLNFTSEAKDLQVYAKYLCIDKEHQYFTLNSSSKKNSLGTFCNEILYESLDEAKTDSIALKLAIYDAIISLDKKTFPTKIIWDMRLLRSFFEAREKYEMNGSVQVLGNNFIANMCQRLDKTLNEFLMKVDKDSIQNQNKDDRQQSATFVGPEQIWCTRR